MSDNVFVIVHKNTNEMAGLLIERRRKLVGLSWQISSVETTWRKRHYAENVRVMSLIFIQTLPKTSIIASRTSWFVRSLMPVIFSKYSLVVFVLVGLTSS